MRTKVIRLMRFISQVIQVEKYVPTVAFVFVWYLQAVDDFPGLFLVALCNKVIVCCLSCERHATGSSWTAKLPRWLFWLIVMDMLRLAIWDMLRLAIWDTVAETQYWFVLGCNLLCILLPAFLPDKIFHRAFFHDPYSTRKNSKRLQGPGVIDSAAKELATSTNKVEPKEPLEEVQKGNAERNTFLCRHSIPLCRNKQDCTVENCRFCHECKRPGKRNRERQAKRRALSPLQDQKMRGDVNLLLRSPLGEKIREPFSHVQLAVPT
ncbi:unnamed protein product [Cladocopium goreaui]|uniref:Uncharacterized protein n=1 Tax=Cladocopium goreaui TaxID=2562237 RepID=A0A9P1CD42_9DINO|nr:unnamed protein product [Cladocopium goreaui]